MFVQRYITRYFYFFLINFHALQSPSDKTREIDGANLHIIILFPNTFVIFYNFLKQIALH